MTYLTKQLPNGCEVGLTNCEIVLPVGSLRNLDDAAILLALRELEADFEFLKEHLDSPDLQLLYGTVDEAKAIVLRKQRDERTREVKRMLTAQRRSEFGARRAQLVLALIERDGYSCQFPGCGCQEDLTIDHTVPLSRGGSDSLPNLRLMCRRHNSQKGDEMPGSRTQADAP